MKSANAKIYALIAVFGLIMTFSSCNKSKDPGPPTVSFNIKEDTYNEDEGTAEIQVDLSAKSSKDVTVNFSWSGADGTYLNGDFSVDPTAIVIPAGDKSASIVVTIIDDDQLDDDDVVTLTLTGTSNNAKLSGTAANLNFDLTIANNDELFANTMQADLTWSTGEGEDIDLADLDLFLQKDVVYDEESGSFTSQGTALRQSAHDDGFETTGLISDDQDALYAFLIPYYEGSSDVDFTLTLNGFGWVNGVGGGSFQASDAGNGFYMIGPFVKDGNTFEQGKVKSPGNHSKILTFKGRDLIMKKKGN